ncbi:MAG: SMP-30/gluconolactonase/LRE family protein [Pirellulales bacterium]
MSQTSSLLAAAADSSTLRLSHIALALSPASLLAMATLTLIGMAAGVCRADDGPAWDKAEAVPMFTVGNYCEGVVFDHIGQGYISHGNQITLFTLDGRHRKWAETGAPNGHKVLPDGTHLVCDASHHAVLHLSAAGKMLEHAASQCDGQPLRGPNDLTLDTPHGGFYFTDPGESGKENPIGTIHYVDKAGKCTQCDGGYAYSNGIVLTPDGKKLYVAESQHNRVWLYDVEAPGKLANKRLFADLPTKDTEAGQIDNQPDGMCLDLAGNLYVAHYGMKQVQVLNPEGKIIARLPGGNTTTSNVAFGGPYMDQLFVTGGLGPEAGEGGLFRLDLNVKGLVVLPPPANQMADQMELGPDSQRQEGVPQGTVTHVAGYRSKVFPGTVRDYWLYVPAQYDKSKPAAVMVFQDGASYVNEMGDQRVPVVFDNLIHKGEMPVTIGLFISPGVFPPTAEGEQPISNRSFEYDTLSDQYPRFIVDEMLPLVGKDYNLTQEAAGRAICGISSGGICAFTVAWERPMAFSKVLSHVGSFTNIRGGHNYAAMLRKTPPKPIRVFLQDGSGDLDNEHGNWPLANLEMARSLAFMKYDYRLEYGDGGHNHKHGGAILPDSLRWLWRGYQQAGK